MKKNLTVIGHRGIATAYPENTLISFEKAIEAGVDAIEFDVHMTMDGELVVTHDATVNRCSNGTGEVSSYTLNRLKALDFGKWKGPEFAGTRIPTLDETLDLIFSMRPGMYLLVELKDDREAATRKVVDVLRRRGMIGNCLVLSFYPRQLRLVKELEPEITLQSFPLRYLKAPCADLYDFIDKVSIWNQEVTAAETEEFHRRCIEVDVYPVDDEFQLEKVIGTGIDSITTNAAHTVIPLLKERNLR
jgi:Glycerophosphoryl diester phosphodiesterase